MAADRPDNGLALKCLGQGGSRLTVVPLQDPVLFDKLPEPEDDENDMLDLAYGLTETCAYCINICSLSFGAACAKCLHWVAAE